MMDSFKEKTIIFGVPKLFNLDNMIETELKAVGFKTINISVHTNTFKYKNIFQHLESFFVKNFLRQRHYKKVLNFRQSESRIKAQLQDIDQVDYIFIIRPEVYPFDFLKELKKKGKKMIGYQWNGLKRYPDTIKYIPLFDRFFVFDGEDLDTPCVLPTTNFYPTTIPVDHSVERTDVFYTGSFYRKRMVQLCDLIEKCRALGLNVHYHLFASRKKRFVPCNLTLTSKVLNYERNIQYTYNTKVLLDLKVVEHEGLSFRILEAVGFEKKLITTNSRVRDYDFFHPNNILIWTGQSKEELAEFIKKPYVPISASIKMKYSFKNWINYMLDHGEYTPIELPRA